MLFAPTFGRMSESGGAANTAPTLTTNVLRQQERIMAESKPTSERPRFQPRDPNASPYARNFLFRLPAKLVVSEGGCWLWVGATASNGYGYVSFGRGKQKRMWPLHRLIYDLCVAPVSDGMHVCHNCPDGDCPLCCNPSHLFLGSPLDNVHDCMSKGRFNPRSAPVGASNPNAKLDDERVAMIRQRVAQGPRGTQKQLETELGLSRATINRIVRGLAWQHVGGFSCFSDGGGI